MPEQLFNYLPIAAIAGGVLLLVASQWSRIASWLSTVRPDPKSESGSTPAERFEQYIALRTWCEAAGQTNAVKSLDGVVLPAIVQGGRQ